MVAHDLCNTAMQFFKVKLNHSLFYDYLLYAQLISVHADKRYVFLLNLHAFFCVLHLKTTITNPDCPPIFFSPMTPMSSSSFGVILDKRGGGIVTMFARGAGR